MDSEVKKEASLPKRILTIFMEMFFLSYFIEALIMITVKAHHAPDIGMRGLFMLSAGFLALVGKILWNGSESQKFTTRFANDRSIFTKNKS